MKNVKLRLEGEILTITVDLSQEFGPSSSGKTIIVASTEGNQAVGLEGCKLGLNVYKPNEGRPKTIPVRSQKAASPVTEYPQVKGAPKTDSVEAFIQASKSQGGGKAADAEF